MAKHKKIDEKIAQMIKRGEELANKEGLHYLIPTDKEYTDALKKVIKAKSYKEPSKPKFKPLHKKPTEITQGG